MRTKKLQLILSFSICLLLINSMTFASIGTSTPSLQQADNFKNSETNPLSSVLRSQQTKDLSGTVRDASGETVIGAIISVDGTTQGSMSDIDGNFTIPDVLVDSKITVRFVGFDDAHLTFTGSVMNIVLQEKAITVDDVVVVGYTTQSRNAITGSVATISSDKLKDQSTANVSTMLQGKVAGVQVIAPSGKPGEKAKITIRGKGSISSSLEPIWVVDGVIFNEDPRLSPHEIETLSILKDASATALYGSRASNGVIVVTTKRGTKGGSNINVGVNGGVSLLTLGNFDLMNSRELYDYQQPWNTNGWFSDNLLNHNTDWFDLATQPAEYINAYVNYSGGGDNVTSYFLADYFREEAAVKYMSYERFTLRSNNDYKINDKLSAFSKIQGQYVQYDDQSASLYNTYLYLPWDYPYNPDGTVRTGKEENWLGRDKSNYLYNQPLDYTKKENLFLQATVGFKYQITDHLSFESNNSINSKVARDEVYTDPKSIGAEATGGSISNVNSWKTGLFTNQMLRYSNTFDNKHNFSSLMAYEYTRQFNQSTTATGKGIISGKDVIDVATGMVEMKGSKSAYNIQSFLMNANYGYDNRYLFQASYRLDGSSKFGKKNQYGHFYTFSGGWNISSEDFFSSFRDVVDNLKLRASWGILGNTPEGFYNHLGLYTAGMYDEIPASFPSQLANPDLTWEKNETFDIGVDFSLLNRIRGSVEYYNKNTSDLLYLVVLPSVSGYSNQWQNIGSVLNRGFEVSLDADIISTEDWLLNFNFNIGFNKNTITGLYQNKAQVSGNRRFAVGHDIDDLYMAEWAGVDSETGSPQWYTTDKEGNRVITTSYAEALSNKAYIGSAAPDFFGGFGLLAQWKGLSLTANFSYSYGGQLYSQGRELFDSDGAYADYNAMNLINGWSRWEKPGDIATHPQAINTGNNSSNKVSSRYVEDNSYLQLRSLMLSYSLPDKIVKAMRLKNFTINLNAENLFIITDYSLVSPITAAHSGDGYVDASIYPDVRKFILGVNISF